MLAQYDVSFNVVVNTYLTYPQSTLQCSLIHPQLRVEEPEASGCNESQDKYIPISFTFARKSAKSSSSAAIYVRGTCPSGDRKYPRGNKWLMLAPFPAAAKPFQSHGGWRNTSAHLTLERWVAWKWSVLLEFLWELDGGVLKLVLKNCSLIAYSEDDDAHRGHH